MPHVTVILNQKGGIGKSTITVNLAAVTAHVLGGVDGEAAPVAAVSIDPQGSAIWWSERVDDLPFHFVDASGEVSKNLRNLRRLQGVEHIIVDTPGFIDLNPDDQSIDPLGQGPAAEALRAVLDAADDVIVPIEPEPLGYMPTRLTIERVVKPRDLPFAVLINNWDPRDGKGDLIGTQEFVRKSGWPLYKTVIRHYKLHTRAAADGQVCTQYKSSRTAAEARADFQNLALEHQLLRRSTSGAA